MLTKKSKRYSSVSPDALLLSEYVRRSDIVGWNEIIRSRSPVDLSRLRLHNATLKGICLAGANLTSAEMVNCDLEGADFSGATLVEANFIKSRLKGVTFNDSKSPRARFDRVQLSSARFLRCGLQAASFIGALAANVDFSEADLTAANFQGADLHASLFNRAILREADLRLADFTGASLADANLENANLGGAEMKSAVSQGAVLTGTGYSLDDLRESRNSSLHLMEEHCVIVHLKLSESYGTPEGREAIQTLCDAIENLIEKSEAGKFDGDEFGGRECVLYLYGPDADRLFDAIRQPLASSSLARGGYVLKRYGPPKAGVKEERIQL